MADDAVSVARLSALAAEIEAAAYARGEADAGTETPAILGAVGGRSPRPERGRTPREAAAKHRARGGRRAPKDSVPRFVERALRDRPGLTAPEILERAATDMERLIKLGSACTEHQTGRCQGGYESDDGRWSLAVAASAGVPAGGDGAPGAPAGPEAETAPIVSTGNPPAEDAARPEPDTDGNRDRPGSTW